MFLEFGHGKKTYDGVGGLLKYLSTVHNYRCRHNILIWTSQGIVEEIQKLTKNVVILNLQKGDVETYRKHKKEQ